MDDAYYDEVQIGKCPINHDNIYLATRKRDNHPMEWGIVREDGQWLYNAGYYSYPIFARSESEARRSFREFYSKFSRRTKWLCEGF